MGRFYSLMSYPQGLGIMLSPKACFFYFWTMLSEKAIQNFDQTILGERDKVGGLVALYCF